MRPSRLLTAFAALALTAATSQGAAASEPFPSRRMTIVTPFAPGASSDAMARVVAANLSERFRQPVVVENKVGGGSLLATRAALAAPADGYTLLFHTNAYHTALLSIPDAGYRADDFVLVGVVGTTAYVLVSPSAIPTDSLASLVAFLKSEGAKANYASLGRGTQQMLLGERFKDAAAIGWQEIPYKSGADVIPPLLTNQVQGFFATTNLVKQQSGQPLLKPVAITSDTRSKYLTDLPTFRELGYPGMTEEGWFMVLAPARTPPDVLAKLRQELAEAIGSPKVREQLEFAMVEPYAGSLEDFARYSGAAVARFTENFRKYGGAP